MKKINTKQRLAGLRIRCNYGGPGSGRHKDELSESQWEADTESRKHSLHGDDYDKMIDSARENTERYESQRDEWLNDAKNGDVSEESSDYFQESIVAPILNNYDKYWSGAQRKDFNMIDWADNLPAFADEAYKVATDAATIQRLATGENVKAEQILDDYGLDADEIKMHASRYDPDDLVEY